MERITENRTERAVESYPHGRGIARSHASFPGPAGTAQHPNRISAYGVRNSPL